MPLFINNNCPDDMTRMRLHSEKLPEMRSFHTTKCKILRFKSGIWHTYRRFYCTLKNRAAVEGHRSWFQRDRHRVVTSKPLLPHFRGESTGWGQCESSIWPVLEILVSSRFNPVQK